MNELFGNFTSQTAALHQKKAKLSFIWIKALSVWKLLSTCTFVNEKNIFACTFVYCVSILCHVICSIMLASVALSVFISVYNWKYTLFPCSYLSRLWSWFCPAKNPFCLVRRKEGKEALMKISADLTTFEIVLFKSTMACIHTYFISIALCMLREAVGIIYVVQEERDKGKERDRGKVRDGEMGLRPFRNVQHRSHRAEAREIHTHLIKCLN